MKIYSAYRCNEYPNNRFVKTFEGNSILEIFQQYYDMVKQLPSDDLSSEYKNIKSFWGAQIYGLNFNAPINETKLPRPETLEDLKILLENYSYINKMVIDEHCLYIYTDDDEIDLAWYVFDEIYAKENPEKTLMFTTHTDRLPTEINDNKTIKFNPTAQEILPSGTSSCNTYIMSVAVYDGGVLDDLVGIGKIAGISLEQLPEWLKNNQPTCTAWEYNDQIKLLKLAAMSLKDPSPEKIAEIFITQAVSSIGQSNKTDEILQLGWDEIAKHSFGNDASKSKAFVSPHLWEMMINSASYDDLNYYDYIIIFDDIWASNYPELAQNILRFASGPKL